MTSLAAGFAAAVLPVQARTMIVTDTHGLTAGEVMIRPWAARCRPTAPCRRQERGWHGARGAGDLRSARAHQGCVSPSGQGGLSGDRPELYARQGDAGKYSDTAKLMSEVVAKVPNSQVMVDLDATAAWAAVHGGDAHRLAITGFCWGGRIVWMYAAHNPKLKTGVAWYGALTRANFPGDKTALEVAASIRQPMLGLYGAADGGIPNDTVEKMRAALKAAGNTVSEIILYPDTPHAFHADYRPSYRKAAAEDGWKRMLAWFKTHGVG